MVRSGDDMEEGLGWGSGASWIEGEDKDVRSGWDGVCALSPSAHFTTRNTQLCSVPDLHWIPLL